MAVQVHGCFWHQHPGCRLARRPKSRLDYWLPKLERNRARDLETTTALRALGWSVLVVWECQVPNDDAAARILGRFLEFKWVAAACVRLGAKRLGAGG